MYEPNINEITADLIHQINAELVGHPIKVAGTFMGVLEVQIRDTQYLNLKSHPINTSNEFNRLVTRLIPNGYKVNWNNTGSCFWLSKS